MKRILVAVAAAMLGLTAPVAARAETVLAVTQVSYDYLNRPVCSAERMNTQTFASLPADPCTLGTQGSYGPDRITRNTYDAAGEVTEVDQAYGTSVQRAYARYSYNANGTKATETDANGNKTAYIYDGFDRLSQVQYPSTSTAGAVNTADYEQFGYDTNGNKTSWRRRNGKTISYSYDNLNRELTRSVSDGSVQTVYTGYDGLGHVLYARYGSTSGAGVSNAYDSLGRLSSITDMNGRSLQYLFDQASNRTRLTYPDANYVSYGYDAANRLTGLAFGTAVSYAYDNLGRLASVNLGNVSTNYSYDNLGRLTNMGDNVSASAYNVSWGFAYTPASQIASLSASSTTYDYKETANTTVNNTYDGLNRDAGIAALGGGYDTDGNLSNDGTRLFYYDVYNRLTGVGSSAYPANGPYLTFAYDPLGRLASQTYYGTTTAFLYDGTNLIGEYDGSGTMTERYVHGSGEDHPLMWFHSSGLGGQRFFIQDYHGSVIGYTDGSGNLQTLYKYGPYGEPKNISNGTDFTGARFRYTGQTVIPEAGLYYYKARVYDPIMGRFLQTDPIGSGDDLDLYAYTAGDPVNGTDPTGDTTATCTVTQTTGPNGTTPTGATCNEDTSDNDPYHVHITVTTVTTTVDGDGNVTGTSSKTSGTDTYQAYFTSLGDIENAAIKKDTGITVRMSDKVDNQPWSPWLAALGIGPTYDPRVRARGLEDPKSHNFPYSYDQEILATKPQMRANGYKIYQMRGNMNGKEGVFEIGQRADGVIDHRFFRPDR